MRCHNCDKEFDNKRETRKFCSDACRLKHFRKNGKKETIKPFQMQALYNEIKVMVSNLNATTNVFKPVGSPETNYSINTQPQQQRPQIALKSFEQYRQEKRECEHPEQWEKLWAEIEVAINLSWKQKQLLKTTNL